MNSYISTFGIYSCACLRWSEAHEQNLHDETKTKQRLEELENQKKELQEKLIIEQSKQQYELSKEDIQNYFKFTMKQCPDRVIELFIRKVNVYEDKIEIFLNYSPNANITTAETISKELFTETFTSTCKFKG